MSINKESIKSSSEYQEALKKIDMLILKVGDNLSYENPEFVMLDRLSDLVADYEDKNIKIK